MFLGVTRVGVVVYPRFASFIRPRPQVLSALDIFPSMSSSISSLSTSMATLSYRLGSPQFLELAQAHLEPWSPSTLENSPDNTPTGVRASILSR